MSLVADASVGQTWILRESGSHAAPASAGGNVELPVPDLMLRMSRLPSPRARGLSPPRTGVSSNTPEAIPALPAAG
nr:hypothetical protein [uncultured Rhodopila sp.]